MGALVGKVVFYHFDGRAKKVLGYTTKENYLKVLTDELFWNPSGFKHETLTGDPEAKEAIAHLFRNALCEKQRGSNPLFCPFHWCILRIY